ncbi:MAG: hypothetical protein AMJ43_05215 [Coxiella sp. DG_40]|nr:MAG: hypothetical protein AMJ43_05215 [Coxiella sp. DG_40]
MCYAMTGLERTQENQILRNDLIEIKKNLDYKKTDYDNAISFFNALNTLITRHQQNIALIPIIVHFKKNILENLNPISLEIVTLQENEGSEKLITDFLDLLKKFNKPTDNTIEKRIYNILMIRSTKYYRLKRQVEKFSGQILLQFKAIAVVLKINAPNFPDTLELKFNIDNFIEKLTTDINNYETRWTLEDNYDYDQLEIKKQQICTEIKEFIYSTFNITKVGLPLHSLVLVLVIKSLTETFKTPPSWLKRLEKDLHPERLNGFNIKTYTTILEAIEQPKKTKSKYFFICKDILRYLNNPKALKSAFDTLSTPLQNTTTIRFPRSFFPDLIENFTLLQGTNYDLQTVVNQDLFLSEIGRNESAYIRFFFPDENTRAEVHKQIRGSLDRNAHNHWSQFRIPIGRQKLEIFKQYLSKLGITSEYLQNYIAVILVQQAVEINIDNQNRQINFSLTVPGRVRTKLLEIIEQFNFINFTILIKNSSNEPQTKIMHDQYNRCAILSFTDKIVVDIDKPNLKKQITIGTAQYFIKLYEDSKLPEFDFIMYLDKEVLQLSDGTKLDLIQMISRYFSQTDIPQLSLEDRRLTVLNKILNDSNGNITLNLLQDEKLLKKLRLTQNGYVEELKQVIQEKLSQAKGKAAKRFETALRCLDRSNNRAQSTTDELSSAQRELEIVVNNREYPKLLRTNGKTALEYASEVVPNTDADRLELTKLLNNIRHLILNFAEPAFQNQLTEMKLSNICRPCGEHLVNLYLNGCQNLTLNKVFQNSTRSHQNLKILYIQSFPNLTKVGNSKGGFNFPNLTELYLIDCPELNSFEIDAPNLRKLQVINCPKLYKLTIQNNVKQDIGINDYVIGGCPKLITRFNLPPSCFIELLTDYADFQTNNVDVTESIEKMSTEASRNHYNSMFFGNRHKANMQKQEGEKKLADFDKRLQTLGITDKYLRDYVKLNLIQGAGENILGRGRDLSFAYAASRLLCQKLDEVIRSHVKTTDDKCITGISNLIPKIQYNAVNESVHLEFADSLSIYDDDDKQTQIGFARYSITVYADRSKLPEFTCNSDLYNSVSTTIDGQKLRPAKIFNPDNIKLCFVKEFNSLNSKDILDEEILFRVEKIAQLMPCYAALHAKLFPTLAVSKYGTQNARFAVLYLINQSLLTTKSSPTDTTVKQVEDKVDYFAETYKESFVVEDHTIKLYSADNDFTGHIPKLATDEFFTLYRVDQNSFSFN